MSKTSKIASISLIGINLINFILITFYLNDSVATSSKGWLELFFLLTSILYLLNTFPIYMNFIQSKWKFLYVLLYLLVPMSISFPEFSLLAINLFILYLLTYITKVNAELISIATTLFAVLDFFWLFFLSEVI